MRPVAHDGVDRGEIIGLISLLIWTLKHRAAPTSEWEGDGAGRQLKQGMRLVWVTPFVVPLLIVVAMVELTYGAQTVQLVLYAEQSLGLGAEGYGYLLAAAGLGGLLSVVVNGRLSTSPRVSGIAIATGVVFCATQLVYAGVNGVVIALVATLIGGIGLVACEVVVETTLARVVPGDSLGRVMGIYDSLAVAAMVLGAVLAPILIDRTSLEASLAILGVAAVAITLLCLAGLRGLDAMSRARADVLASRVAIIEQLSITQGSPRIVMEELASASQVCPLPPGVDVVVQGAPAHAFYVVMEGEVIVHRDGQEVVRLGPGEYFGERGLLDNAPRNATVTTSQQSAVLRLEGDVLLEALESAPFMRSALSNGPGRRTATAVEHTSVVDDPRWEAS